jgi:hypothetical protein
MCSALWYVYSSGCIACEQRIPVMDDSVPQMRGDNVSRRICAAPDCTGTKTGYIAMLPEM